jgi:hypothetical protein
MSASNEFCKDMEGTVRIWGTTLAFIEENHDRTRLEYADSIGPRTSRKHFRRITASASSLG